MRISDKQKRALEKITGKAWNTWCSEAIEAYFAFTDTGQRIKVSEQAEWDFEEIMEFHHWHSVTVEWWKQDFQKGLLFLSDFINQGYPLAYIKHAFEIYEDTMGFIPSKYRRAGMIVGVRQEQKSEPMWSRDG